MIFEAWQALVLKDPSSEAGGFQSVPVVREEQALHQYDGHHPIVLLPQYGSAWMVCQSLLHACALAAER